MASKVSIVSYFKLSGLELFYGDFTAGKNSVFNYYCKSCKLSGCTLYLTKCPNADKSSIFLIIWSIGYILYILNVTFILCTLPDRQINLTCQSKKKKENAQCSKLDIFRVAAGMFIEQCQIAYVKIR